MPIEVTINDEDPDVVKVLNLIAGDGVTITVEKRDDGVVDVTISVSGGS